MKHTSDDACATQQGHAEDRRKRRFACFRLPLMAGVRALKMCRHASIALWGCFASLAVFADDALPQFWVLGIDVFLWGAIWVVMSEATYCLIRLQRLGVFRSLFVVVTINSLTTFLGLLWVVVAPNEIALFLGRGFNGTNYEGLLSEPYYQVYGVLLAFLIGYLSSSILEAVPFWHLVKGREPMPFMQSLKHSALFNGLSYTGLVLIYLGCVVANWGKGP